MKKNYFLLLVSFLFSVSLSFGQHPVINEVDADQSGTDTSEFIELKWDPNTSLDGYVVVFFNGSDDASYAAFDLDGKTTDANGFFILATTSIATGDDIDMGSSNTIQNGPDAVAIFQADATDFPEDTALTTTNLVSALVYDTNDNDDNDLLTGLGETVQYNEGENGNQNGQSVQRKDDGTYAAADITFRADNQFGDPCVLTLSNISSSCNANTSETDTYSVTINFSGGNTGITYTITALDSQANSVGTISGDNPNSNATGTITITDVSEGTNFTLNVSGGAGSSCNLERSISSPTCLPAPTCPANGAIIITEIMQNPAAVNDADGEYFEVYNTTSNAIDLLGWTIRSQGSGNPVESTITSSLVVPANGYAVFGENADLATNGGVNVDFEYDPSIFLGNGSMTLTIECSASVKDEVSYDDGATFPDPTGASMELATNKYSATDNDSGANWAEASEEITSGGDLGTPGSINSFTLSTINSQIVGFRTFPNPVTNQAFTVSTDSFVKKTVSIFNVLGKRVHFSSFSGQKKQIQLPNISRGLYLLKVTEGNKTAISKLVVR